MFKINFKTHRNLIKRTLLTIIILALSFKVAKYGSNTCRFIQPFDYHKVYEEYDKIIKYMRGTNSFLISIGESESGNRYGVVNTCGYIGKYQFGIKELHSLGMDTLLLNPSDIYNKKKNKILIKRFLECPAAQELAMYRYLKFNNDVLGKYIIKYNNQKIELKDTFFTVTRSGILAAAHLSGHVNVIRFFNEIEKRKLDSIPIENDKTFKKHDKKDKFGTSISKYMSKFAGKKVKL